MGYYTRDLPSSPRDFALGWLQRAKKETTVNKTSVDVESEVEDSHGLLETEQPKKKSEIIWTILIAGSGLFSDGYINNSISTASLCLSTMYPDEVKKSNALSNVASIAFAGTIIGQLSFGYVSDKFSRKLGMIISSGLLIVFSILCAGSYGYKGHVQGTLAALTAYRFFLGIGIGSEYPTGSVACAEASALLPPKKRNRYFCWFTNFSIDMGFVVSSIVPFILYNIFKSHHLEWVWRLTLGLGAIPPFCLLFMRMKFKESESFQKTSFKKTTIPYFKVLKFYWFRLIIVSLIWFVYDFCAYAFGLYSSYILAQIIPDGSLFKTFGWNIVFNLFYIPGAFLGAIASDFIGPRLTLVAGLTIQAIFGFALAGSYSVLKHNIAGFVVVYGIFMTMGEFGPGDNIGCLASKTSATAIRGTYYSICAAVGKVGAFVGTYIFPIIIKNYGGEDSDSGISAPYYVASILAVIAAIAGLMFLPDVSPTAMLKEDESFLDYLQATGYDMSKLGDGSLTSLETESPEDTKFSTSGSSVKLKENAIVTEKPI